MRHGARWSPDRGRRFHTPLTRKGFRDETARHERPLARPPAPGHSAVNGTYSSAQLLERIGRLEIALTPFAKVGEVYRNRVPNGRIISTVVGDVSVLDLVNAADALNETAADTLHETAIDQAMRR